MIEAKKWVYQLHNAAVSGGTLVEELPPTGRLPDQEQASRIWADLGPRLDRDPRLSAGRQVPDENAAAKQHIATAHRVSAPWCREYFHGDARVV